MAISMETTKLTVGKLETLSFTLLYFVRCLKIDCIYRLIYKKTNIINIDEQSRDIDNNLLFPFGCFHNKLSFHTTYI